MAALFAAPGAGHAKLPHWQIMTPGLEANLERFYEGGYIPRVELPRENGVTVCFGAGCSGQVRIELDQAMEDAMALAFISRLDDDTAEAEAVAIGYAIDYFYYAVESKLRREQSGDWVRDALQTGRWECKTHAQNVTAVMYQLQRLGLMKHNRLGPIQYRSGHFFGTMSDSSGAVWQVDSYFGDTAFSIGANCRSDTPICIQRLR